MSQKNVELVERVAALNDHDVEGYLACYTDDVQLRTPVFGGVYDGPAGIRRFFTDVADAAPEFQVIVDRLEPIGADRVLAFLHLNVSGRVSGIATPMDTANVYDFVKDKIARTRIFLDRAEALKAVGLDEEAMSQENVELIQRGLARFMTTGEPQWEMFDEDVEIYDHDTPDQGVYRGHAGVARWLEEWGAAWAAWSIEPEEFIDAADSVVVFIRMKAQGRGSGVEVERRDAQVWRLRSGKVVRGDYYNNRQQALEAVGLSE